MTELLVTEREYLKANHEMLLREYPGKFLLIKGAEVYGGYDTEGEAIAAGRQKFPDAAAFLVRHVEHPDDPVFHAPVLTAGIPIFVTQ